MAVGERSDGARGGIASSHVAPPTRSTLIILPSLPPRRHLRLLLGVARVRATENVGPVPSAENPSSPEGSATFPSHSSPALANHRHDFPTATGVASPGGELANPRRNAS